MPTRSSRKPSSGEADMFGPAAQGDLFGGALPRDDVYVPKQPHVRNSLIDLLEDLRGYGIWADCADWKRESMRDRRGPDLVKLIWDTDEAADWKRQIDAEIARLDAASAEPPPH